jgi:hypothetical protein
MFDRLRAAVGGADAIVAAGTNGAPLTRIPSNVHEPKVNRPLPSPNFGCAPPSRRHPWRRCQGTASIARAPKPPAPEAKAFECKMVAETETHMIFGVSISKQAFRENCNIAATLINTAWQP